MSSEKRFPFGFLRNGSAGRNRRPFWFVNHSRYCSGRFSVCRHRLGCRRHGKLQSFFSKAIAPNTFLRQVRLTISREQLCLVIRHGRCVFIWCEFLAVRATPYRASCGLAWRLLAEAPHPRPDSSWPKREGSQVARQLGSNNRPNLLSPCLLLISVRFQKAIVPWYNAEDLGGGQGSAVEATRAPSQGPRPNGAARCRPLLFGIGTKALNPNRQSVRRPQVLGTLQTSFVCSTCAR